MKIGAVVVAAYVTAGLAVYAVGASSGATLGGSFAALAGNGATLTLAGAISAGAGAGFASGFAGSLLNGGSIGDAFKAGAIGGLVGGVTAGVLHGIGAAEMDWFPRGVAHGVVQGGATEAIGGEFRHGFYAGFAVGASEARIGQWAKKSPAHGIAAAATVGGTASALGGGKFANGAVSGAFSYMFNQLAHEAAEKKYYETSGSVAAVVLAEEGIDQGLKGAVGRYWRREINRIDGELNGSFVVYDTFSDLDDLTARLEYWSNKTDRILISTHGTNDWEKNPILGIRNSISRPNLSASAQDYWRTKVEQSVVADIATARGYAKESLIFHRCLVGQPTGPQQGVNLLREKLSLPARGVK